MLYWECKRRLVELRSFRELVREYFEITQFDIKGQRREMPQVQAMRQRINLMVPLVVQSANKVGYNMLLDWVDPVSGLRAVVNVIENMFNLYRYEIPLSWVFDFVDRAIGEYERMQARLRKQSWNPFYWLRLGFLEVLSFPFRLLGAAGFNTAAFEQTVAGRVLKLVVGTVVFTAALLTCLSLLGLPTGWRYLVHVIHHR